jgi:hypothetical protein
MAQRTKAAGTPLGEREVIKKYMRSVQRDGSGESVRINLTDFARDLHDISPKDKLLLLIYHDGIWIDVEAGPQ